MEQSAFVMSVVEPYLNLLDDVLPVIIEQGYEVVVDDRRKNEEMSFSNS